MAKKHSFLLCTFLASAISFAYATNTITDVDYNDQYSSLNLSEVGLSHEVFILAMKGLGRLEAEGKLHNVSILTVADYSQSSNQKRLYVIDLAHKKLLFNTYVAHGRNTGEEFAREFSNGYCSYQTSLGFYVTRNTMIGPQTGFALTLDGVEKGFNDNAFKRAIIMHGANYVSESFIQKNGRLGRSLGCPALPPELTKPILETIKNGTCLFLYNPDPGYLCQSTLLN